jgi:ankyrin repeat protein
VKRFITAGANVRAADALGRTALHYAAKSGQTDTAALLIEAKADLEHPTREGEQRPLHHAVMYDADAVVDLLLEQGAQVEATNVYGGTALNIAAELGRLECVKRLVQAKANVNVVTAGERNPLFGAAERGHEQVVRALLEAGADAAWISPRDKLPTLYAAALSGSPQVVKLLIDHGAKVDAQTAKGETALIAAAYAGKPEVIEVLLGAGADKSVADERGRRALDYAAARGDHRCMSLLYYGQSSPTTNPK